MNTQDQNNARLAEYSRMNRILILERTFGVSSDEVSVLLDRLEEGEGPFDILTEQYYWQSDVVMERMTTDRYLDRIRAYAISGIEIKAPGIGWHLWDV